MNTTLDIKIEKGIPIEKLRSATWSPVTKAMKSMKVGDSFICPMNKRSLITWASRSAGIVVETHKISDTEVRVWRVM